MFVGYFLVFGLLSEISKGSLEDHEDFQKVLQNPNLLPIQPITIKIPLNILFVGFQRDDLGEFRLNHETLATWFEHVEDHVSPTLIDEHGRPQSSMYSSVFYDFQIHVVETHKLLDAAIEAALKTFMRREAIVNTTIYQVDADRMSSLFESLLHAVGLSDSYTIIVMNPDTSFLSSGKPYGYRTGFSQEEIAYLHEQYKSGKQSLTLSEEERENYPADHDLDHEAESIKEHPKKPVAAIDFIDVKKKSEDWASSFLIQNRELINQREKALKQSDEECNRPETIVIKDDLDKLSGPLGHADKRGADGVHARGHQINMEKTDDARTLSRHILRSGSSEDRKYLQMVFHLGPEYVHANCLVDAWIGRGRYAWLDISAGPFTWGPTLSVSETQLVRSRMSFPRIKTKGPSPSEEVREKIKRDLADDVFGDGQFGGDGDELEVLLVYWERYCRNYNARKQKMKDSDKQSDVHFEPVVCRRLAERLKKLGGDGDSVDEGRQAAVGGADSLNAGSTTVDAFLAHLGSSISVAIREVIAPPMRRSAWTERRSEKRIHVKVILFILTEHTVYDPLNAAGGGLDVDHFTKELKKFETANLEISVIHQVVNVSSQPLLAYLFSYALKAIALKTASGGAASAHYIDSAMLGGELWSKMKSELQIKEPKETFLSTREIPIGLFSLNRRHPVLIDVDLQAKALDHVILAVQNYQSRWSGTVACDGAAVEVNLRNPTDAVLSAVVTHLTGLVSHREGQSRSGDATCNWLWSVGTSPFSATSSSTAHISAFQRDAVHRHSVTGAIQRAVDDLHAGRRALKALPGKWRKKHEEIHRKVWRRAIADFRKVHRMMQKVSHMASQVSWQSALEIVPELQEKAESFRRDCNWLAQDIKTASCRKGETTFATLFRLAATRWPALLVWSVPFSVFLLFLILTTRRCFKHRRSRHPGKEFSLLD